MKFYAILIKRYTDDKADSKAIYEYETQREAIAAFHSSMGVAMKDATCTECLCVVLDINGMQLANEHYMASVEVEAEVE